MQIYHFLCKGCGYESKLPLGSSDLDQILTDVNADYAEYHLFRCNKESKFVHADIHSKDFDGTCTVDGSKLEEINPEMFHKLSPLQPRLDYRSKCSTGRC